MNARNYCHPRRGDSRSKWDGENATSEIILSFKYILRLTVGLALIGLNITRANAVNVPNVVRAIPVQYQGRVMPFESYAREQILSTTGKLHLKGESPSETVLRWMSNPNLASDEALFEVGYDPLRKEVGLDPKRRKYSLDELLATRKIMQLAAESNQIKQQEGKPTRVQSEAEKLLGKMGSHYALITGQVPAFIPVSGNADGEWRPIGDSMAISDQVSQGIQIGVLGLSDAFKAGNTGQMAAIGKELSRLNRERWNPGENILKRFDAETSYNKYRPIQWARTLYLIGLLLLLASLVGWREKLIQIASGIIPLAFLLQLAGMGLRAYIGARAPWSNFYESMVAITAVFVLLGLLFGKGKLKPFVLGATAFVAYAALLIADNSGLTPGVDTLVPALQSYWLNIHVIVILAGYAAATLAMILGHVALGIEGFNPGNRELFLTSTKAIYRAVQMAMLLLFAGTILGGVWAHEAWGRYWGWDPKETWALISWFAYVGVAHARFAGWLNPRGLALASIGVYPIILMTYYGVNYLLSGLHSYAGGESAQIPPMLIGFLIFEALVVFAGAKGWHTRFSGTGGNGEPPTRKDPTQPAVAAVE